MERLSMLEDGRLVFRRNEYVTGRDDVVSVYLCDKGSDFDQPRLWDGHRAVVASAIVEAEDWKTLSDEELLREYFL